MAQATSSLIYAIPDVSELMHQDPLCTLVRTLRRLHSASRSSPASMTTRNIVSASALLVGSLQQSRHPVRTCQGQLAPFVTGYPHRGGLLYSFYALVEQDDRGRSIVTSRTPVRSATCARSTVPRCPVLSWWSRQVGGRWPSDSHSGTGDCATPRCRGKPVSRPTASARIGGPEAPRPLPEQLLRQHPMDPLRAVDQLSHA